MSSSNQTIFAIGEEATAGVPPANFTEIRRTGVPSFGRDIRTIRSDEIIQQGETTDSVIVGSDVASVVNIEWSAGAFVQAIQGMLFNDFSVPGVNGTINSSANIPRTYTAVQIFRDHQPFDSFAFINEAFITSLSLNARIGALTTGSIGLAGNNNGSESAVDANAEYESVGGTFDGLIGDAVTAVRTVAPAPTGSVFSPTSSGVGTLTFGGENLIDIVPATRGDNAVTELTMNFVRENNQFDGLGFDTPVDTLTGNLACTGTLRAYFDTLALLALADAGNLVELNTVFLSAATHTLQIRFPNVRIGGGSIDTPGNAQKTATPFTWEAVASGGNPLVEMTIIGP